jgi:hypothetical protein
MWTAATSKDKCFVNISPEPSQIRGQFYTEWPDIKDSSFPLLDVFVRAVVRDAHSRLVINIPPWQPAQLFLEKHEGDIVFLSPDVQARVVNDAPTNLNQAIAELRLLSPSSFKRKISFSQQQAIFQQFHATSNVKPSKIIIHDCLHKST